MKRLTFKEPCGKWGIVGMEKPVDEIEDFSIYICLEKLCDYEELGLNPDDMEQRLMELRDYKETGLEPAEIEKLICEVSSIKQVRTAAELICSKYENLFSRLEDMEENLQIIEKELSQLKNISKGEI